MKKTLTALLAGAFTAVATFSMAGDFKPAVIYDMGGKFDKSFNQSVSVGIQKFIDETGVEVMEFEVTNEAQREQAMNRMLQRGATIVLGIGFGQADAMNKVAGANPDKMFSIIDVNWLDQPNLRQYAFKEHEGSYLVGMAAAMASKTGTVGFVGGMDIPLIQAFSCGYSQGAMAANADVKVLANMTGTTPAAWNDPAKGAELAQGQIDRGADVIFQAAGGTGVGVIQAAVDAGKMAIGVDANQNYLAPGSILTSMLKRVDVAAYETMKDAMSGNFETGVRNLGLAEGGVGYALDEHNKGILTQEIQDAMNAAKDKIVAGEITVHDYRSNNSCKM